MKQVSKSLAFLQEEDEEEDDDDSEEDEEEDEDEEEEDQAQWHEGDEVEIIYTLLRLHYKMHAGWELQQHSIGKKKTCVFKTYCRTRFDRKCKGNQLHLCVVIATNFLFPLSKLFYLLQ